MGINCPYGNLDMDMRANPNPQISSCQKPVCNRSAQLPGDPCFACGVCWVFILQIISASSLMEIPVLFSGASGKLSVLKASHESGRNRYKQKKGFSKVVFQRLNLHLSSPWNALYGHCVVNKGWILHHLIFTYELFSLDPYIHSLGTIFQETIYNLFIFFHTPSPL